MLLWSCRTEYFWEDDCSAVLCLLQEDTLQERQEKKSSNFMKSEGSWSFSQEPKLAPFLKQFNPVNILKLFFKIQFNVIPYLRIDPTSGYIPFKCFH
jgi:hypothetical protein